jgi:hypothetical protein
MGVVNQPEDLPYVRWWAPVFGLQASPLTSPTPLLIWPLPMLINLQLMVLQLFGMLKRPLINMKCWRIEREREREII